MTSSHRIRTSPRLLIAGYAMATLAIGAFGQTAPAPSNNEEVITMSPFDVVAGQDRGYLSTSSASITRLATPVKDLPVDIMIINPDVMNDLSHTSLYDFGRFIVGSNDHGSANQFAFDMRGFNSESIDDTQRDGFRSLAKPNVYNIDRIEVIMGPNTVVQGAADPGGQVNVVTKSAMVNQNFDSATAQINNFGGWRAAIDTNVSKTIGVNDIAIRVNAVEEEGKTFVKFSKDNYTGIAVAAKDDLWKGRTQLVFKFEYLWEEYTFANNIIDRWSGAPGLRGGYDIALAMQIPKLYNYDEANAMGGPDELVRRHETDYEAQATQRISDHANFQITGAAAVMDEPELQSVGVSPSYAYNATTNTFYDNRATTCAWAGDTRYNMRAIFNYDLDLGWMDQKFIAGASFLSVHYFTYQDNLYSNTTNAAVTQQVPLYPGAVTAANFALNTANCYWQAQAPSADHVTSPSYYINSTGSYFGGKILTVFGYSWNSSTRTDYFYNSLAAGASYHNGAAEPSINHSVSYKVTADLPMLSLIYKVTPDVSLFADYSKSFKPQTAYYPVLNLQNGQVTGSLGPITGEGYEGGIKFDAPKTGLTASIDAYQVVDVNIAQVLSTNTVAALLGTAASLAQRYYVPGTQQTDKGAEVQLFYNPTPAVSMMANYAYSSAYITQSTVQPSLIGQEANVHFKQNFNGLAKYTFLDGSLKGWFLGANTVVRGREWRIQNAEYGTNAGYAIFGVLLGYSGKMGTCPFTIQANVDNVFDKIYMRTYAMVGEPRQGSLTVDLKF